MACEISAFKLALDLNISMPHISFPPVEKGNLNEAAWKSCLQAISVGSGPFFPLNQQNEHQSTQAQPPNAAHCGDVMESQQGADSNSGLEESDGSFILCPRSNMARSNLGPCALGQLDAAKGFGG